MNIFEQLQFRTSPNISGFVSALHCFLIPDSQEILGNWHALNSCPTDRRVKSLAFARLKSLARPRWKRSFVGETRFRAHTATTEPGKCWDDFAFISPHYLQLLKRLRVSFRLENTLHLQGFRVEKGLSCLCSAVRVPGKARNLALPSLKTCTSQIEDEQRECRAYFFASLTFALENKVVRDRGLSSANEGERHRNRGGGNFALTFYSTAFFFREQNQPPNVSRNVPNIVKMD